MVRASENASLEFLPSLYSLLVKVRVGETAGLYGIIKNKLPNLKYVCVCVLVTQSCLTLCDLMDCSPPGSSVHGILQARVLEWVAMPFSKRSSRPMDQTQVSHIAGRFFAI